MTRVVLLSTRAQKDIEALDLDHRQRVVAALDRYAVTEIADVKKLAGSDTE